MEMSVGWSDFHASVHFSNVTSEGNGIALKRMRIVSKVGCRVGPTMSVSFSERPVDVLALVSNTTLVLVVVLLSFSTECIGRK